MKISTIIQPASGDFLEWENSEFGLFKVVIILGMEFNVFRALSATWICRLGPFALNFVGEIDIKGGEWLNEPFGNLLFPVWNLHDKKQPGPVQLLVPAPPTLGWLSVSYWDQSKLCLFWFFSFPKSKLMLVKADHC